MKLFSEQRKGEKVYLLERKHLFLMARPLFILFSALVALFLILKLTGFSLASLYLIIIFITIFGIYGFWLWSGWNKTVYILTNFRALEISQEGFFTKEVAEAPLENIRDVRWKKVGFWATIFNFGDVKIKVLGGIKSLNWQGIPNPEKVKEKIRDSIEDIEEFKNQKSKIKVDL